jgi:pimeloyl-ACP methyl ester carboxylesterase
MSTIAQLDQGPVEYRIAGSNTGQEPAILVLNGGHTHCDSPLGHEPFFLKHGYQLIVPSRPGYGKTPSSVGKTADAFADVLVSLLDHLHIDRVIVVGISAGGPTTLQFAARHPERVSKVILQNAVISGDFAPPLVRLGAHVIFNRWTERFTWAGFRMFARLAPMTALKSMLGSLTSLPTAQVLAAMTESQKQAALAFLLSSRSGSGFLLDLDHQGGDLRRISAPTLIITSQYDGSVDFSHPQKAAADIPNAELFVSPAESHLMWFSAHNAAIEAKMESFLQLARN